MSLPVVTLVTSQSCGHCTTARDPSGGRILGTKESASSKYRDVFGKGLKFDVNFFRSVMTAGASGATEAKVRLLLIHVSNMVPNWSHNEVLEMSIVEMDGPGLKQTMFLRDATDESAEPKTLLKSWKITDRFQEIVAQTTTVPWSSTVSNHIPTGLVHYLYYFPQFSAFGGENWERALRSGGPLYGVINGKGTNPVAPFGVLREPGDPAPMAAPLFVSSVLSGSLSLVEPPQKEAPSSAGAASAPRAAMGGAGTDDSSDGPKRVVVPVGPSCKYLPMRLVPARPR